MTETKINISELKSEGSDLIKELADFLKEKTNTEVESGTTEMILKGEEGNPLPRTYTRLLLRKFLHTNGLKDYYRVIGGKENTLIVKAKKIAEQEEE
jgi:hypothetical protein